MHNVPAKTECGCPSGGGIKIGHIRYPSYGGMNNFVEKNHHPGDLPVFVLEAAVEPLAHLLLPSGHGRHGDLVDVDVHLRCVP